MNTTQQINPELIVAIEDTKKQMIQVINTALQIRGIPCSVLEMLMNDLTMQIRLGAREELTQAREELSKAKEKGENT